ncbi:MAG: hypothetical protein HUK20_08485 [Fibrobacter sp.]|nr:hypothetical protein [Fibrobacter sp.]
MKKRIVTFSFFAAFFAQATALPDFVDPRDKQVYKTIQIGDRRWMAENLRYNLDDTYCYNNSQNNCDKFGRFYDWAATARLRKMFNSHEAEKKRKEVHDICPEGWHVSTNEDWMKLIYFVYENNTKSDVGRSIKSKKYWSKQEDGFIGTDDFGFNALPAGGRSDNLRSIDRDAAAYFWAAEEEDASTASLWTLHQTNGLVKNIVEKKEFSFSVRCVEDKEYSYEKPKTALEENPTPVVKKKKKKKRTFKFPTVRIGDQIWMAENLKVSVPGSYCYNDDEENCNKYGRLFTWAAAMALPPEASQMEMKDQIGEIHQGICPEGWHIPNLEDMDWLKLFIEDDGDVIAARLKARKQWPYSPHASEGIMTLGFSALPSGIKTFSKPCDEPQTVESTTENTIEQETPSEVAAESDYSQASENPSEEYVEPAPICQPLPPYIMKDSLTGFWTNEELTFETATARILTYDSDEFIRDSSNKQNAFPVRCILDPPKSR